MFPYGKFHADFVFILLKDFRKLFCHDGKILHLNTLVVKLLSKVGLYPLQAAYEANKYRDGDQIICQSNFQNQFFLHFDVRPKKCYWFVVT